MHRRLLPSVVVLAIPAVTASATPIELNSTQFDLPESDRMFPDGPGSDDINNNYLACHSADMVLNQPAIRNKKMIDNCKAPIARRMSGQSSIILSPSRVLNRLPLQPGISDRRTALSSQDR